MKKISNMVKISGPSNKDRIDEQCTKTTVKVSLSQIQKLSQQIDQQFANNKCHKQNKLQTQPINEQNQQKVDQDPQSEDSNYWPQYNPPFTNQEANPTSKAINQSIQLYLSPCQGTHMNQQIDNKSTAILLDPQSYEEYKKVKSSNAHFIDIISKVQALRRHSLVYNDVPQTKNQSDILLLIEKVLPSKTHKYGTPRNSQEIQAIKKLEEIQQSLQSMIQSERDLIEHRKKIIRDLKANKGSILDDMELLSNRNRKLDRQLHSFNSQNKFDNSSSQEEPEQQHPPEPLEQKKGQQALQYGSEGNGQMVDYEREYIELMMQYHLYDVETHQVEQSFPKNKTQAMMFLNKLQTKIQQLEMQKALISLSL